MVLHLPQRHNGPHISPDKLRDGSAIAIVDFVDGKLVVNGFWEVRISTAPRKAVILISLVPVDSGKRRKVTLPIVELRKPGRTLRRIEAAQKLVQSGAARVGSWDIANGHGELMMATLPNGKINGKRIRDIVSRDLRAGNRFALLGMCLDESGLVILGRWMVIVAPVERKSSAVFLVSPLGARRTLRFSQAGIHRQGKRMISCDDADWLIEQRLAIEKVW